MIETIENKIEKCEYLRRFGKHVEKPYRCVKEDCCEYKIDYAGQFFCRIENGLVDKLVRERKDKQVKNGYGYDMEKEK